MVIMATTIKPHLIWLQRECGDYCLMVIENMVNESRFMPDRIEVYFPILNIYESDWRNTRYSRLQGSQTVPKGRLIGRP